MLKADQPGAEGLIGIDVCHFQQDINWTVAAAAGISYCFIKATEGVSREDARFAHNWRGTADAGILRGAYHFFRPADSVTAQANFFLCTISQPPQTDLPPVLDLENPAQWANIPLADRAPLALQWLEAVERSLTATPLVYLSPAFAAETLAHSPLLARFPVWLAEYTTAPAPSIPKPWEQWTFWQHTNHGTTPGIAGFVDLNRFNGTLEQLWALKPR